MLDHVPGLFTSTMPAIVRPRKTSSETRRPLGFAAKTLGDISVLRKMQQAKQRKENLLLTLRLFVAIFANLRSNVRVRVLDRRMSLMLAEIAEQPAALERTIAEERAKIAKLGNLLKSRDIHLIVLVARGSSDNAALFGRYLLEITTGIPVSLSAPSVHTIYNARLQVGPCAGCRRVAIRRR